MATSLASLEWAAPCAERENTLRSLREAREHRRLLLRVLADFERTLDKPAEKETSVAAKRELAAYYARVLAREQDAAHD
jgi:hypothetical protein